MYQFLTAILFWLFILCCPNAPAQPPTITQFTPLSARPGDVVTITGTNFNTTAANNVVFFGATKAMVTTATATSLAVTVPTGATYAPLVVFNTSNSLAAYSAANFNPIYSPAKTGITATDFLPKQDFTTGTSPYSVAIGDLDGDGKPDLVLANSNSTTVSIFRNTSISGSIGATSFAAKVDFTTGSNPFSVAIGDIDGDGKPDLVTANYLSANISILRNTSTSGSISASSFATKVDFAAGNNPQSIAIGDLDGDGKPDIAAANFGSNTLSIFRNTSTSGTISPSTLAAKQDFTTGAGPTLVAISDLDGDGKADVAVVNQTSNTASVLRNTSNAGVINASSFAAKVDFTTGTLPLSIAIGDLDGDGKPDMAVANYNANTVSVLRNTSSSGSINAGSFAAKVDFATGVNPYSVAIGDANGNGKPDLAVANRSSYTVSLYNNTATSGSMNTGSFAAKQDFSTGELPYALTMGDLDGDGKPDLAVANHGSNTVSIIRNADLPAPTITSFTPTTGVVGTSVTITGTNFNTTAANNIVLLGATRATVSAATATSLTVAVPSGATYDPITVLNNATTLAGYSTAFFNPVYSPAKPAIVATDFQAKVDFATANTPFAVAIGDLDGDGKPDMAVAHYNSNVVSVYHNTSSNGSIGAGSFAAKVDFAAGSSPHSIAIGDLDGDGKPELAVGNDFSNSVSIFKNTSTSGSITASSFAAKVDFSTGAQPFSLAIDDLDGDGKPDLVTANLFANTISVLRNISSHQTIHSNSFAPKVDFAANAFPDAVAIGDLDGDGKLDIAVTNQNSANVSIYRNTSTSGSITTGSFAAKVDFVTGNQPAALAIGDLDGDAKPDLAIANGGSGSLSVLRNTGTTGTIGFAAKVDFTTGTSPTAVAIGDLDGDGKPDLAATVFSSSSLSVFRNTSTSGSITTGSFATKVDVAAGTQPRSVAIADLEGGGRPDLVVANSGANTLSVLRNANFNADLTALTTSTGILSPSFAAATTAYVVNVSNTTTSIALTPTVADASATVTINGTAVASGTTSAAIPLTVGNNSITVVVTPQNLVAKTYTLIVNRPASIISAFTPVSAKPGDVVTITGTHFNTTATDNVVFFGATRANVTAATATSLTVTVPIGASFAPLSVLNTGTNLTAFSQASFNPIYSPAKPNITGTDFLPKQDFTAGTNPQSMAIGDLDGDGKADLAVVNSGANTVSIYRNTGSSGSINAGSFAAKVDFATGNIPYSVAIGDLDGDGKPDMVVTNFAFTTPTISLFRNISTSGSISASSFAPKVDITIGFNAVSATIGDMDGDGKPDIVLANFNASMVSILRNTSTSGSITVSSFAPKVDFATGSNPYSVAIGDLDGDGKPDLAVANFSSSNVSVLRNTGSSGSITGASFAPKVDFAAGTQPRSLSIGDLDGDGKSDIAVANGNANSVSVLRNTSTAGSIGAGSFATKVDFATGAGAVTVAMGDLDGNGKPDLVVTNFTSNTVSVFGNTGSSGSISTGSFAPKIDFTVGTNPIFAVVGDWDGDALLDIAVANQTSNNISILRNADLPPTISSITPASAKPGDTVAITGTNFNATAANNLVFFGATRAAVTAATNTSLTVTVPSGATYSPIGVLNTNSKLAGSSSVNFNPIYSPAKTNIATSDLLPKQDFATGNRPYAVAIGDLDGDGKPDLVVPNRDAFTISVFRNTSTNGSIDASSFAPKVDFATGNLPYSVAIADIDGDGKLDLAVACFNGSVVSVLRNTSSIGSITAASFAPNVDFTVGGRPIALAIGDLDGDGKPDIATANFNNNTTSILRNTSTVGAIDAGSFAAHVNFATSASPYSVAIGDVDGDNKPDLIMVNNGSNTLSLFRNTSTRGSMDANAFAPKVDFATATSPRSVTMGDLDGDSKSDIAVACFGSNALSVFRNTAIAGTIDANALATKVDFTTGSFPWAPAIGDINGDGKPDLAVTNYNANTVSVFKNTSTSGTIDASTFAAKVDIPAGNGPLAMAIGDLDGDGKPDLAVANVNANSVSVIRNANNNAYLSALTTTAGSLIPSFVATTTAYTASVSNATTSVTVTPTTADPTATVTVNGIAVASGTVSLPIALAVGVNTITVLVTAQDAVTTNTYTIAVTRAAPMALTAPGNALHCDGVNDYVMLPSSLSTAATGNDAITIAYWFKGTNTQSAIRFQGAGGFIIAGLNNSTHNISTDGSTTNGLPIGAAATDGNWHHIAFTWKRNTADSGFRSFLDGRLVAQRTSADVALPLITENPYLGALAGTGEFMSGSIDEVRIYNTALTQSDIQASMFTVTSAMPTHLLAYYDFDNGMAGGSNTGVTQLPDQSGNGHNGTLSNFALVNTTSNWITSTVWNTWLGTSSNNWNTAANWHLGTVPAALDNVVIPTSAGNVPVVVTGTHTVKSVTVQAGVSLLIQGLLNVVY